MGVSVASRLVHARSLAAVLGLAGALAACGGAAPGPTDTVLAYAESLRENRYADAWRLLSSDARAVLSYDDFARAARENPEAVRDAVNALSRVDGRAPVTARLELGSGETLTLYYEGGQWRLDPSALEFYGQHTPRQALRSFVRAMERQRWDVLLRLAPRRVAEGLTTEQLREAWGRREADAAQQTLDQLRRELDRDRAIEVVGDRATMTYGTGGAHTAQLVREDGLWKIERFQ